MLRKKGLDNSKGNLISTEKIKDQVQVILDMKMSLDPR